MSTPNNDPQVAAYVDLLRRIAELTERGVLPRDTTLMPSFWFRERDEGARERTLLAVEALGGDWRPSTSGGDRTLGAQANLGGMQVFVYFEQLPVEEPPREPVIAFAAELNAAARGEVEALIAAQGEPITREAFEADVADRGESHP